MSIEETIWVVTIDDPNCSDQFEVIGAFRKYEDAKVHAENYHEEVFLEFINDDEAPEDQSENDLKWVHENEAHSKEQEVTYYLQEVRLM